jgi:ubiquinone biosynthesis protein UbiJ
VDPVERVLRPLVRLVNESIRETTPARELCAELDGTLAAVRVRDTALAMYLEVGGGEIRLASDAAAEPDILITGSLTALAKLAASGDEDAIRDGTVDLVGDAGKAARLQRLLRQAKPDPEEQLSRVVGDAAAHQVGRAARGFRRWAREAHETMLGNVREYLQEESRDVPSRYEVERFGKDVSALRDDVDRLEARLRRLEGKRD